MENIWELTDANDFVIALLEHLENKTQYGDDMSCLSEAVPGNGSEQRRVLSVFL